MTKEYIERETLLKEVDSKISDISFSSPYQNEIKVITSGMDRVRDLIEAAPTVDVVEVIRCKECRHATFYSCKNDTCYKSILCEYQRGVGDENFFCSYGERKE